MPSRAFTGGGKALSCRPTGWGDRPAAPVSWPEQAWGSALHPQGGRLPRGLFVSIVSGETLKHEVTPELPRAPWPVSGGQGCDPQWASSMAWLHATPHHQQRPGNPKENGSNQRQNRKEIMKEERRRWSWSAQPRTLPGSALACTRPHPTPRGRGSVAGQGHSLLACLPTPTHQPASVSAATRLPPTYSGRTGPSSNAGGNHGKSKTGKAKVRVNQ